ncbi:Clr5 domain-containing protein [Immersiella caudata]|uniref:Clr5 domain-containing protein n=1 Tax=Immersiella caudata TaxID=314043 RepID=A0AA40BUT5_9PEZI|nr:Clr5 domain-containing protein [Immersiella caudata]
MGVSKRRGPSAEDWATHRSTIESLYIHQGKELRDVSEAMRQAYGFTATPRQYVHRFTLWRLRKNIPHHAMHAMVVIRNERQRQGQGETTFTWNGHPVDASRLDRFLRREGISNGGELEVPRPPTPKGVCYYTSHPEYQGLEAKTTSDHSRQHQGLHPTPDWPLSPFESSSTTPAIAQHHVALADHATPADLHSFKFPVQPQHPETPTLPNVFRAEQAAPLEGCVGQILYDFQLPQQPLPYCHDEFTSPMATMLMGDRFGDASAPLLFLDQGSNVHVRRGEEAPATLQMIQDWASRTFPPCEAGFDDVGFSAGE